MTTDPAATSAPEVALRAYCERFAALDRDSVLELFDPQALLEIPLLPARVFGVDEIRVALGGVIRSLNGCEVELRSVGATGDIALGEGHLRATAADGPDLDFGFGIVVETRDGRIVRLTEYFDTDPILPFD